MRPIRLAMLVLVAAGIFGAVVGLTSLREESPPPVVSIEDAGYLYTYHVLSGTEALFDLREDPRRVRNLTAKQPARARELRVALSRRLGVEDLDQLRKAEDPLRRQLESLGYLR